MKNAMILTVLVSILAADLAFAAESACEEGFKTALTCKAVDQKGDSDFVKANVAAVEICEKDGEFVLINKTPQGDWGGGIAKREVRAGATTYTTAVRNLIYSLSRLTVSPSQPINATLTVTVVTMKENLKSKRSLKCE